MRLSALGAIVMAPLIGVGLGVTSAQAATLPVPAPARALPAALDVLTPYEPQVSCEPDAKPGVTAFGDLMFATYNTGVRGYGRTCAGDTSEHYDGRALDWMLNSANPQQKAVADAVVAWLTAGNGAMARRFGISYIIWNRQMWREYRDQDRWLPYTGSVPHTDHIHFSFSWDGAMKRTSWWTGTALTRVDYGPCQVYAGQFAPRYTAARSTPCPASLPQPPASIYPVFVQGQQSPDIAVAQKALNVTADGDFGPQTLTALLAWQRGKVPVTGVLDKASWALLAPGAVRPAPTPVAKPPVAKPPTPAPVAKPPVAKPPAPKPVAVKLPVVHAPAVKAPAATTTSYTAYKAVTLRLGSKGAAVKVLQLALGGVGVDGDFGAKTRAAVVKFQQSQRIPATGVVDRTVWDRLERRDNPLLAYRNTVLRKGSTGAAVTALQKALKVGADGQFGPLTERAVKAAQAKAHLAQTGVVATLTWQAIDAQSRR